MWLIETARNILSRFTVDAEYDGVPISPNSSMIVFSSRRRGHRELYLKSVRVPGLKPCCWTVRFLRTAVGSRSSPPKQDEMKSTVRAFPGAGGKSQISTNGGTNPQWRHDGRELFYMGPNNRLMAVPIKLPTNGQAVEAGTPVTLFTVRPGSQYEAAPDGQRFLLNTLTEGAAPITVILNWAGRPK